MTTPTPAAGRGPRDVVKALVALLDPGTDEPLRQVTVASPATTGVYVNVLLDPAQPAVPVRQFAFITTPVAGDVVWIVRTGSTYICLGKLK